MCFSFLFFPLLVWTVVNTQQYTLLIQFRVFGSGFQSTPLLLSRTVSADTREAGSSVWQWSLDISLI